MHVYLLLQGSPEEENIYSSTLEQLCKVWQESSTSPLLKSWQEYATVAEYISKVQQMHAARLPKTKNPQNVNFTTSMAEWRFGRTLPHYSEFYPTLEQGVTVRGLYYGLSFKISNA